MAKVKTNFTEWLVLVGIIKKGRFPSYSADFVLNTDDLKKVFEFCDKKRMKGPKLRVEADYSGYSYYKNFVDAGRDLQGRQLVELELILRFSKTPEGKVKVNATCNDPAQCNARLQLEKGYKTVLIKEFGEIE